MSDKQFVVRPAVQGNALHINVICTYIKSAYNEGFALKK